MKLDIIKSEDIYTKGFKYISNFSESNTLPYHNINHLLTVFNNSYSASKYYKLDEILGENSTKELCLAALFHDTNHSGGELSDVDNVNNSIKFFKKFYNLYNGMEDHFSDNVCKIISCTKYPYDKLQL